MSRIGHIGSLASVSLVVAFCVAVPAWDSPRASSEVAAASERAARSLLLDACHAGERIVAVGERGHVVLSDDGGASWRQADVVPTRTTLSDVYFIDEENGWAVGHDAVIIHTANGGKTWSLQHRDPALDSPLFALWLDHSGHGIAVGAYGLALETKDGGAQWQPRRIGEAQDDRHLNALFEDRNGTLFIAAEGGHVYRSEDGGLHWVRRDTGYPGSFWGGIAMKSGRLLVFGMRGHLAVSDDGGNTWRPIATVSDLSLGGAAELAGGEVVVAGLGGSLLVSRDGGLSFAPQTHPGRMGFNDVLALPGTGALLFGEGGAHAFAPAEESPASQ